MIAAAALERLLVASFEAGGFPPVSAATVARHLVDAELKGVASHGVNRLGWYLRQAAGGDIDPKARPTIDDAGAALFRVDGGGGLGILAMEAAVDALLPRARASGLAMAAVVNCGHTGRIGAYVERAARAGYFSQCFGGGGRRAWANVVPYGGARPVMSTNPFAFGLPGGEGDDPVVVDFAISGIATGKAAIARAEGKPLPEGSAIDKHGNPTTSAAAYYDGGALLPAAGPKGSGLGVIAELVGDAMLGIPREFNWLILALPADAFRPMADYQASAADFLAEVRATPPAPGFTAVALPGEPEAHRAAQRVRDGVPLSPAVRDGLIAAARSVGIDAMMYGLRSG